MPSLDSAARSTACAANATALGFGWTDNYNLRLEFSTQYSVTVASFIAAHGSHLPFAANPDGTFSPEPGVRGNLVQNSDGTYSLSDAHQNRYLFDSSGRLTQIVDANGNAQTLTYNGAQLDSVGIASGRWLHFSYDGNGRISGVDDPLGRHLGFGYNGNGDLTSVTDVRGLVTTMTYDGSHHLLTIADPNHHTQVTNHYDAENRVDYQLNALNQQTTLNYGSSRSQTVVTDPRGYPTSYNYDLNGLLVSVTDALGRSESYVNDGNLNRRSVTDRNGHQTQFTWTRTGCSLGMITDALGNKASSDDDSNGNLLSVYDPLHRWTQYTYDGANNLLSIIKPISGTIAFAYDALGDPVRRTDENNHSTQYGYDSYGNRTVITDTLSGVTRLGYDVAGRMTDLTDALGSTRQLYNSSGQIVADERFDPFGNPISQTGTGTSIYGFAGEPQDPAGLDYFRARYYDPASGRFISQDPWGGDLHQPGTQNGWSYAENDPALVTDPSGLCTSGIGTDQILSGLLTLNGGQVLAGLSNNWQECQENVSKAQQAWQQGDYVRAVTWGTGVTTIAQRAACWVYDNNRDLTTAQDSCASWPERAAAGERVLGRGFQLAASLVPIGLGAKSLLGKAALADGVLAEAADESGLLQDLATQADRAIDGSGHVAGTLKHTKFSKLVDSLGRSDLNTEISYLNGAPVKYGTRGSIRVDVVQGALKAPSAIYDLKTGSGKLTSDRIEQILSHLPNGGLGPNGQPIPIIEIRP
ncbi:MAG: hypothetical protein M1132_04270 [Chloroflexi bacterium]|nr:hypothetical protein [Chloroflexota bacterium]